MKTALVCALLALVPLSSLRMVCVTAHVDGDAALAAARTPSGDADAAAGDDECQRICTHRPEPATPAATVTCVLVADASCQLLTTAAFAVMPPAPRSIAPSTAVRVDASVVHDYLSPVLARQSPPPRS